jgi:hypothetical protein
MVPVEPVILGLADTEIGQHDAALSIRLTLHRPHRCPVEREFLRTVARIIDHHQIVWAGGNGRRIDLLQLVAPAAHGIELGAWRRCRARTSRERENDHRCAQKRRGMRKVSMAMLKVHDCHLVPPEVREARVCA